MKNAVPDLERQRVDLRGCAFECAVARQRPVPFGVAATVGRDQAVSCRHHIFGRGVHLDYMDPVRIEQPGHHGPTRLDHDQKLYW